MHGYSPPNVMSFSNRMISDVFDVSRALSTDNVIADAPQRPFVPPFDAVTLQLDKIWQCGSVPVE